MPPPGDAHPFRPKIVVITGPTAVGKTGLALRLAETRDGEIINADSMQVYRHMDVGTAKPTPEERARAPHHLFDLIDPDMDFDAAAYLRLARSLIRDLDERGRMPLVVGGTGLYLRSLLKGLFEGPGQDALIRKRLKEEARRIGNKGLHDRLVREDPETAGRLHPNDLVRVVRALEVLEITGRPISEFQKQHALAETPFRVLFICLNLEREELYDRINRRTEAMFRSGLLEETARLLDLGFGPELKTMRAIGYRQAVLHLAGQLSLEEAVMETAKETRRFAKRQLTWYRSQPEALWRSPHEMERIVSEVEKFWE